MCGPQRDFEKFMPDDEPICDHDTEPTGERDEEGLKITKCKHCSKEFVKLYSGRKRDATDN
jgi:hypothetical protein